ncbi:MAG TPA: sugar phosphate isomerase/epimerase [Candidatus Acutalibacter pullicola]|uniref:Sugar phosphate isomerase/epimerase n=1 Tax=Candidatus Acutalibacter pullicola TaxID=2838417 RepID=A0A9D2SGI8_9FIRM|nr:sugar phosphate isomerase/epimerase [Candidatus Acutalibacter pullicola]
MEHIILSGFSDEIAPELDLQLAALQEWGVTHLELRAADGVNVSDFTPEKVREVKAKLEAAGISVSSIGSPLGKIGIQEDFAPHLDKLKRTLEIQKELGAPYVRMFSFYIPQDQNPADFREEVLDRLGRMVEEAKAWDSVLLHENEKDIYGDNASRCKELMDAFYGPHFQAVFDFANFVQVGQETLPAYELLKPYVTYVHVKDAQWGTGTVVPAGQGDGHVGEILADLIGGGWKGFLSLEPHLTDFAGLAALEQDPQKRGSALDGKAAWKLALDALHTILETIPQAKEAL